MNIDILIDPRGPFENGYIIDEQLVAGEYPGDRDNPNRMHRRLNSLLQAGVTAFLDTTEPQEHSTRYYDGDGKRYRYKPKHVVSVRHTHRLADYNHLLPENVTYARFPILDVSIPSKQQMLDMLTKIKEWREEGRVVYVHCRGGIGRTGVVVGCYLREQGFSGRAALRQIDELRRTCAVARSPETATQEDFIWRWPNVGQLLTMKKETFGTGKPNSTPVFESYKDKPYNWYYGDTYDEVVQSKKKKKKNKTVPPIVEDDIDLSILDDLLNTSEDDNANQVE
jgi:protein-tyrosine phosphatase